MNRSYSIFIVDDDLIVRESLEATLSNDFHVEVFPSCEACAHRLAERIPDMLLLDVSLPGMDGYEFCRRLKADAATGKISVTFISASDTINDRLAGYEAGADDFIIKPVNAAELRQKARVAQRIKIGKQELL